MTLENGPNTAYSSQVKDALANARADAPDFHVDLGDTFMTDKHGSREDAARQYLAQRFCFGQLSQSAPLYLVLGNHDGEESRLLREGSESLAVWSNTMRKRYFPNPRAPRVRSLPWPRRKRGAGPSPNLLRRKCSPPTGEPWFVFRGSTVVIPREPMLSSAKSAPPEEIR